MSSSSAASPQTPAERFALIMLGLLRCVGARVTRNLRSGGYPGVGMAPLPEAMAGLVYARLERARSLFAALAERVRLGTARAYPNRAAPRRPTPAAPSVPAEPSAAAEPSASAPPPPSANPSEPAARTPAPDAPRLPRRMGGVLGLLYWEAAYQAEQLRQLLADPEMVAMIRSAPGFARILRPLCRMLGVVPPDGLFAPVARRPRRVRRRVTGAPGRIPVRRSTLPRLRDIGREPSLAGRDAAWRGGAWREPRKS